MQLRCQLLRLWGSSMAKLSILQLQQTLACQNKPSKQNGFASHGILLTLCSLGTLPTDPYSRRIPNSDVTIVFRNYTIAISGSDSRRCIEEALGDVLTHGDGMHRKVQAARLYAWGTVELSIVPLGSMRWLDLSYAAKSLLAWLRDYDSVDMNLDIVIQGIGLVGTGRLANVI